MEELADFIDSCEFATPVYFWIAGALALLLIFIPWIGRKNGLSFDLQFWKNKFEFKSRRVLKISVPVIIATVLLAGILAQPQITTRPVTYVYGYPVMLVVDISGSMGVGYSEATPFGKSYEIFSDLIAMRGDINFGLLLFSTDMYIARYFINKNELFADTLENRKEIAYLSVGTRISGALEMAHEFMSENIDGGGAIILISDMDTSSKEWRTIVEEMTTMSLEGIMPYIIAPSGPEEIAKKAQRQGIDLSLVSELQVVAMDDDEGIDDICSEIATMKMSLIREEEGLLKKSMVPYFVIPVLALFVLCLVLSETRFRKIP
jgi:hypothetical protein